MKIKELGLVCFRVPICLNIDITYLGHTASSYPYLYPNIDVFCLAVIDIRYYLNSFLTSSFLSCIDSMYIHVI